MGSGAFGGVVMESREGERYRDLVRDDDGVIHLCIRRRDLLTGEWKNTLFPAPQDWEEAAEARDREAGTLRKNLAGTFERLHRGCTRKCCS